MLKTAEDLAKEYDFDNEYAYFEYIVDSLINGQRQQVRDLFNKMTAESKEYFTTIYLETETLIHVECSKLCIQELLK